MTDAQRPQVEFADVASHELDIGPVEVPRIGAAAEQEAVQRGDFGPAGGEVMTEIGAEETRAPGDENLAT